jgi:uncharacterized protein (TIGR02246 family)
MNDADAGRIVDELVAAWNGHDMSRFAACFAEDADFVNVAGMWWRGRSEIEHAHAAAHAAQFKHSVLTAELAAFKQIAPDVGVAHVTWELSGHGPSGPQRTRAVRKGIWSFTLCDRAGGTEIVSAHNTDRVS